MFQSTTGFIRAPLKGMPPGPDGQNRPYWVVLHIHPKPGRLGFGGATFAGEGPSKLRIQG